MRKKNIFSITLFLGFIFLVFRNWFLAPEIIGGDWPYFFSEMTKDYFSYFSVWKPGQGNGLGGISPAYPLGVFHGFTFFVSHVSHIPWTFVYKFSWFSLFLVLSILSTMHLLKTVLPRVKFWQQIFASMVFSVNTYILMVVSGGQMGVALSYSMTPLVLARFIKIIDNKESLKDKTYLAIIAGLVLAIQVMFDPRIAYISMIAVGIYASFNIKKEMLNIFLPLEALAKWGYLILFVFVIPGLVTVLLHATWILPILFFQSNPISQDLVSVDGFRFFSFADFSHAFSLLHPNWPENIFGKIYFMKAEFILLPIIAYSGLFFKFRRRILFFALVGIVGSFLAKGANSPFGEINTFLFEHIPGMNMFRDPTKFYLLIVLSYSVLIPFSIYSISEWLSTKCKVQSAELSPQMRDPALAGQFKVKSCIPKLFLLFTMFYLLFLIRPAIFGQLGGTFKKHEVPKEYVELKDFLYRQPDFFRTLWVPRQQRFSFTSDIHPAIEAEPLFGTRSAEILSKKISSEQGQALLSELSVKYVLIQYDSLGEQFLDDRKYSEDQRMEYERKLDAIPWLRKIQSGKITVYETPFKKDHFFLEKTGRISAIMVNLMRYVITVSIDQPQNLIFSESYNPYWILTESQKTIPSKKTKNGLNSFWLDQKGKYTVDISFSLEKYYKYGQIISFMILSFMLFLILRKKA